MPMIIGWLPMNVKRRRSCATGELRCGKIVRGMALGEVLYESFVLPRQD